MAVIHNLGFPSIGHRRELKTAVEAFWKGKSSENQLIEISRHLRAKHWYLQKEAGLDWVPVGDFSFYDRMLDTICLLGAAPARFNFKERLSLADYFIMARGSDEQPAMEMTKWFDTNYHYIVPEFTSKTRFELNPENLCSQLDEALALGIQAKPVIIGPLTFLYLGKAREEGLDRLSLLQELVPVYQKLLVLLKERGIKWVQIEEPALVLDLPDAWLDSLQALYTQLAEHSPKILLTTYFNSVASLAPTLKKLPVAGIHLDLVRSPEQLTVFTADFPADKILSLGCIDGRNIWRSDLGQVLALLEPLQQNLGERLWIAPSCSLMHIPVDLNQETKMDDQLKSWLAFGLQRLEELALLKKGLTEGQETIQEALAISHQVKADRQTSSRIHNPAIQARMAQLDDIADQRDSQFKVRQGLQRERFHLPTFPTTTIGSFPQTKTIREARAAFKKGNLSLEAYKAAMQNEIKEAIARQESIGLDVLVHGEAERNDMVEYFGEQLAGFAFTQYGWVQSYGSRCVKPPIIYGDVYRPNPMTIEWICYAQSLTQKPVKGMLTGPVTILQWSFYRNDQSREQTAYQIALAIRDEVKDLEAAGIQIIQIDEPAYREGLPLKKDDWAKYLSWASKAFRLSSSGVKDETQIHTHMCYSEFNDIFLGLVSMDADVITIESSRSDLELLKGFASFNYPNEIGPGVYDVHSPSVPTTENMVAILKKASQVLSVEQIWVNPDCGLKTREWQEVEPALRNMVEAAKRLQVQLTH